MKTLVFILISINIFGLLADLDIRDEDEVLILNDNNFDDFLAKQTYVLVEFYAPWCEHCKQLAPEYSKAAKMLKEQEQQVPLAKVDATENKELAERFNIEGFPTIKFFSKQVPFEFTGGRTAEEIVQWVNKKLGPSSSYLESDNDFQRLIGDNEVAVVFFGEQNTDQHKEFLEVSKQFDDIVFGHTDIDELKQQYLKDSEQSKIILFKQFDEGRNDFEGAFKSEEIYQFIDKYQFPLILPFNQKVAEKIFGENNSCLFLFIDQNESSDKAKEAFESAAQKLKGKIYLSMTEIDSGLGQRLAEYIGISEDDLPSVRIVKIESEESDIQKYVMEGDITEENIIKFQEDFSNNLLKPVYKSEEIPEQNDDPVKVLVAKSFNQVVMDSTKDVMVEFYAPWCEHCKELAPIYEILAEKVQKQNPNIIIAKIDATANEIEDLPIKGYPTIKFWKSNDKQNHITFEGELNEEEIMKFLKENSTTSWNQEDQQKSDL